jgi:FtsZ-interacting cell division protein ZipA
VAFILDLGGASMKTAIIALVLVIVGLPAARPALARRHDEFELKEMREQREEHQEEKAAIQEELSEEREKEEAHARAKPRPQERHGRSTADDGDLDAD